MMPQSQPLRKHTGLAILVACWCLCGCGLMATASKSAYRSPLYTLDSFHVSWRKLPGLQRISMPGISFSGPVETRFATRLQGRPVLLRPADKAQPFTLARQGQDLVFTVTYPLRAADSPLQATASLKATLTPHQIQVEGKAALNRDIIVPMDQTRACTTFCVFPDQALRNWTFYAQKTDGTALMGQLPEGQDFSALHWLFAHPCKLVRLEKDGQVITFQALENTVIGLGFYREILEIHLGHAVVPGTVIRRNEPMTWNYLIRFEQPRKTVKGN